MRIVRVTKELWVTGDSVCRHGLAEFAHLIRAKDDPERKPRPPNGGQADKRPHLTFNKKPIEHWKRALLDHMGDGVPRTFNRMGVELWDKTADVMFTSVVNDALWALVAERSLEHTTTAPILFRRKRA